MLLGLWGFFTWKFFTSYVITYADTCHDERSEASLRKKISLALPRSNSLGGTPSCWHSTPSVALPHAPRSLLYTEDSE